MKYFCCMDTNCISNLDYNWHRLGCYLRVSENLRWERTSELPWATGFTLAARALTAVSAPYQKCPLLNGLNELSARTICPCPGPFWQTCLGRHHCPHPQYCNLYRAIKKLSVCVHFMHIVRYEKTDCKRMHGETISVLTKNPYQAAEPKIHTWDIHHWVNYKIRIKPL